MRLVLGVGRLEADPALLLEEALEGDRVLLDLGHDDVAVAGGVCGRITTKSPSAMCASIIESPRTRRTYASPLGAKTSGTARVSSARLVGLDRAAGGDLADDRQEMRLGGADWGVSSLDRPSSIAAVGVNRMARAWAAPRSRKPSRSRIWR